MKLFTINRILVFVLTLFDSKSILSCTEIKWYNVETNSNRVITVCKDGLDGIMEIIWEQFVVFVVAIPDLSYQITEIEFEPPSFKSQNPSTCCQIHQ